MAAEFDETSRIAYARRSIRSMCRARRHERQLRARAGAGAVTEPLAILIHRPLETEPARGSAVWAAVSSDHDLAARPAVPVPSPCAARAVPGRAVAVSVPLEHRCDAGAGPGRGAALAVPLEHACDLLTRIELAAMRCPRPR